MDEIRGVVNGLCAAKPNRLSKWVLLAIVIFAAAALLYPFYS